jgi:hypothetical protein
MNILLISPFYAPENQIASHRITAFAKYWAQSGNKVTVLTREPAFLGLDTPQDSRINVIRVKDPLSRRIQSGISVMRNSEQGSVKQVISIALQRIVKVFLVPDRYVLWSLRAKKTIKKVGTRPDVIVTSIGPASCLNLAIISQKTFNVPLVLDYRDLVTDLFDPFSLSSQTINAKTIKRIEQRAMNVSSLISAVTKPMCEVLEAKYSIPSVLITNGFEEELYSSLNHEPNPSELQIVFAGTIYPGLRDPTPLFQAISMIEKTEIRNRITVHFYGNSSPEILATASRLDIEKNIYNHGPISHSDAIKAQVDADILLLLYWDHPNERASYSGKLFEYIGSRRPILAMGIQDGVGPRLIKDEKLGEVLNDPKEISEYLIHQVERKFGSAGIESPPRMDSKKFTRSYQSKLLLESIIQLKEENAG